MGAEEEIVDIGRISKVRQKCRAGSFNFMLTLGAVLYLLDCVMYQILSVFITCIVLLLSNKTPDLYSPL